MQIDVISMYVKVIKMIWQQFISKTNANIDKCCSKSNSIEVNNDDIEKNTHKFNKNELKYKIFINKYKIIKICEGKMKKPFTRAFIFVILDMTQDEK